MPRTLHLIKHGKPTLVEGVPAHEWHLADDALTELPKLIDRLKPVPQIIISSEEPKAKATAQALAAALGVPCRPMVGLHEHLRYTNAVTSPKEFRSRMLRFFAEPDKLVIGEESAADARTRFGNAINAVMQANPQENVAVVAHGTVISLLVAQAGGLDPVPLWESLDLLGVLSVAWPQLKLNDQNLLHL